MWSTISEAVRGGWGATGRLVVILVLLGAIIVGAVYAAGGTPLGDLLRWLATLR